MQFFILPVKHLPFAACAYNKLLFQDLIAGEELFGKYDLSFNRHGLKSALKVALDFGHLISGRSRKDFADFVRPIVQFASNAAENFNSAEYVNLAFEGN